MDERDFYTEKIETKSTAYTCPKCRRRFEFQIRWLRRTKKKNIPPGANDLDRAKFAKATDYLVRVEDQLICPNPLCGKRFDIPRDQTVALL
jgi:predicted alpha/beta-hydrolase family hydrolase